MKFLKCVLVCFFFISCDLIKTESEKEIVARVGEDYLYKDEVASLVPKGVSKEDSMLIVQNYINSWATKELLIKNAEQNLDEKKVQEFEVLVSDYKTDLYTKAYLEALVLRSLDTVVKNDELRSYYDDNKENFKLNEDVVKIRFLGIPKENNKINKFRDKFKRYKEEDHYYLDSLSYLYTNYMFNDSLWIKSSEIIKEIPPLTDENLDTYLKKSQFFELQDSLGVYLMTVKDFKKRGEAAPLSFIRPTIRQIILNQRKIKFIKELKKDIINDAIKDKQFEIYEDAE
ncbi:hypothetical protein NBRC110019_12660 [Neptunitalea chrysea]|uniref:Peptidyl-prolyl cis-trans isomerase n=1 Tax=Neptunitalea chrysea TaxID=1647581 RepID=A0A9W6B6J6_9FLAO|nr:peptidyl-prolyl cis-trans isomerase [Neptunitalea chrysea]GLB52227.1 hypothetical protein NBRC110019_12660 [Neptunitalea chrysea]